MMIDVIGLKNNASKFREKIILLVGRAIRSNHANRASTFVIATFVANFSKPCADQLKRFFPGRRRQFALFANERLRKPLVMMRNVETVAALKAQQIAVKPALVAVLT